MNPKVEPELTLALVLPRDWPFDGVFLTEVDAEGVVEFGAEVNGVLFPGVCI